jgi:hypothetical protein
MRRFTFDRLLSIGGFLMVLVLCAAGGLLLWAASYTHNSVSEQLAAQQIYFPPANSPAIAAPEFAPMQQYAGEQLTTGPQAKVYADYFIANHLKEIGGGKTYAQISAESLADPTNTQLHNQAQTIFQGNTLRGLLLTSSAFWELGTIALWAAIAAFVGAFLLVILAVLGYVHSLRVHEGDEVLVPRRQVAPTAGTA